MITAAYVDHLDVKMARFVKKLSLSGEVDAIASRCRILYNFSAGPVTRKPEIANY
jgi:hypothetical protein